MGAGGRRGVLRSSDHFGKKFARLFRATLQRGGHRKSIGGPLIIGMGRQDAFEGCRGRRAIPRGNLSLSLGQIVVQSDLRK